nr:MAG: ORF1 [TTV-like mini virus]
MYYYRPWRRSWRRRRTWRRKFRRPFQRRFWRRRYRRYRVRKRKLKYLKLKEWQPHYIKKLKVVGIQPLLMTTSARVANNFTCYAESVAPHLYPGGGGFSIMNFTLNGLYEDHLTLKNWWTVSNDNMPLIRYLGCKLQLYRQAHNDYLFLYNNSYPMTATSLTYTSTHPNAMLLHKHTRIIACKHNNKNKKPYKKIFIKPPSQMQNKWYFQKDLSHIPLLQTIATATSLDRMFLNSGAISNTIGFVSLDILGFQNHYYSKRTTTGYQAIHNQLLFGLKNGYHKIEQNPFDTLVYLGNAEDMEEGYTFKTIPQTYLNKYSTESTLGGKQIKAMRYEQAVWGNPFYNHYFHGNFRIVTTNKDWDWIYNTYKDSPSKMLDSTNWTFKTQKYKDCRYNPLADKGTGNKIYLINIKDSAHDSDWTDSLAVGLITDLPIWLALWGYLDYNRKCGEYTQIDTNHILVIYTKYIQPQDNQYFVPLDKDFLDGVSPYQEDGTVIASDYQNWHPKVRFQVQTINLIASTGPGVIKLPEGISAEAHMKYHFYFKIGGQPPPMSTLTDPDNQPKYTIPNNLIQTTSLQSPATPIEYLLYNFDERRGTLTKTAAERIKKYKETETALFPITESSHYCPTASKESLQTPETSDSEKEETSIEEQLLQQRKQQKLLRKRIQQLLNRLTVIS